MHLPSRVAAALAAATVTATVPSAHAATDTHHDGTGDVWKQRISAGTDWTEPVASAKSVNVDATRTDVTHGPKRVRAEVTYVELTRTGRDFSAVVTLRGSDGEDSSISVQAGPGDWSGTSSFWRPATENECADVEHRIDYADDTVTLSAPRDCLAEPTWVKYQVSTARSTYRGEWWTRHIEDVRSDQARPSGWSSRVRSD